MIVTSQYNSGHRRRSGPGRNGKMGAGWRKFVVLLGALVVWGMMAGAGEAAPTDYTATSPAFNVATNNFAMHFDTGVIQAGSVVELEFIVTGNTSNDNRDHIYCGNTLLVGLGNAYPIHSDHLPATVTYDVSACVAGRNLTTEDVMFSTNAWNINPPTRVNFMYGSLTFSNIVLRVTPPSYTITYHGNGHTGGAAPTDSNTYFEGDTVTVLDNTGNLTKTDHTFGGWNTQADGNGTPYQPGYTFSMGTVNVTLYAVWTPESTTPTTQATNVTFSNITTTSLTINWTPGDGANRIVLMKSGSAVDVNPVDNTFYIASTTFGSGTQVGTGNYLVYNSNGTSVTVTGLIAGTTYHVAVFEYNGSGGTEKYLTTDPAIGSITLPVAGSTLFHDDFSDNGNLSGRSPLTGGSWSDTGGLVTSGGVLDTAGTGFTAFSDFDTFLAGGSLTLFFTTVAGSGNWNPYSTGWGGLSLFTGDAEQLFLGLPGEASSGWGIQIGGAQYFTPNQTAAAAQHVFTYNHADGAWTYSVGGSNLSGTTTSGLAFDRLRLAQDDMTPVNIAYSEIKVTDIPPYTVTTSAGAGGSIAPTSQVVAQGYTATFTVTPDSGYAIDTVTGCSGNLVGNIYTTGPVTGNCTVGAAFNAQFNNALHFDGANDIVDVGDVAVFQNVSRYTVEAWVKFDGFGIWETVFAKRTSDIDRAVMLQCYGNTGQMAVAVNNGYGYTSPDSALSTGIWYHVAIVYDGIQLTDAERLKFYVNGVSQNLTIGTVPAFTPGSGSRFVIGAEYNSTDPVSESSGILAPFHGTIDELRVWSVARTQTEIQNNKDIQLTGSETGLNIYYNFNQGTASGDNTGITILNDSAGTPQNGTLWNFALTGSTSNWVAGYQVPADITVTFDPNGGEPPDPVTKSVTLNEPYGALATTTRAGYAFSGWFTAASGGTEVTSTTVVSTAADHTLYAQWTANTHTVTPSAGTGGTVSPSDPQTVEEGQTTQFTVTASINYTRDVAVGGTCPQGSWSSNVWTTGAITADCTVSFSFTYNPPPVNGACGSAHGGTFTTAPTNNLCSSGTASGVSGEGPWNWSCVGSNGGSTASCSANIQTWTVTAQAGEGGSVSPASQTVNHGATATVIITPEAGYSIDTVGGTCGGTLTDNTYTTNAVTANCMVEASFTARFTVTGEVRAWAGGGSIEPESQMVEEGETATLTVTPDTGSSISTVIGCNGSLSGNTYTTGAITEDCEVVATFSLNSYTLTATATPSAGGAISPATRTVSHDDTASFTLSSNWGYQLSSVTGCNGARTGNIYITGAITGACTVNAAFTLRTYNVTALATANGSITPGLQSVTHGNTTSFTVTPGAGYTIQMVAGCNGTLSGNTYTTGSIIGDCLIMAFFEVE